MSPPDRHATLPPGMAARLNPVCDRFEAQLLAGSAPRLEEFLVLVEEGDRAALLRELLELELVYRVPPGEQVTPEEYHRRLPKYGADIDAVFSSTRSPRPAKLDQPGPNATVHRLGPEQTAIEQSENETSVDGKDVPSPADTLKGKRGIGPKVCGYEILGELGRGGMGVVYKARQTGLDRLVALKMILGGSAADEQDRARFRTEAEAVARLKHPNIVAIHDIGEHEGLPYFSLEFCDGGSLAARLQGNPLPPREAAQLLQTLARAMHHAHERGIIHRDLKPTNILLGTQSQELSLDAGFSQRTQQSALRTCVAKITDFGLAKKLDVGEGNTQSGAIVGTPSYMAPEQAGGKTKEISPRTDVYSLGAVLYELLTGRPPFKAATPLETVLEVVSEDPVPPSCLNSKLPRDLEVICLKCLEKISERRYASAESLANDLGRFLAGEPILARPVSPWERALKWARRHPARAMAFAMIFIVFAGLAVATALLAAANERERQAKVKALEAQGKTEEKAREALDAQRLAKQKEAEAEKARDRAELEAAKANTSLAMLADSFDEPFGIGGAIFRISSDTGKKRPVQALLKSAAEKALRSDKSRPEIRAAVLETVGSAYQNLGLYAEAETCLQKALGLLLRTASAEPLDLAVCYRSLGRFHHERGLFEKGDYDLSREYYGRALDIQQRYMPVSAAEVCETKFGKAWLAAELEEFAEASQLFDEIIDLHKRHPGHLPQKSRLLVRSRMGRTLVQIEVDLARGGKLDWRTAFRVFTETRELMELEGDLPWKEAFERLKIGLGAVSLPFPGSSRVAELAFRQCDSLISKHKGPEHFCRTIPLLLLARTFEEAGRPAEADEAYRHCLGIAEKTVGLFHTHMPTAVGMYATFLHRQGKSEEAHRRFIEVLKATKQRFGERHFFVASAEMTYASFLKEIKDFPRLEKQCSEARNIYEAINWQKHTRYEKCLELLAVARRAQAKD